MLNPIVFLRISQRVKNERDLRTPRDFVLNYIESYEIIDSIDNLTKTCKITIPNSNYWDKNRINLPKNLFNEIRYGDSIKVYSGYLQGKNLDDVSDITEIFDGWVTRVENTTPITIMCQDHMFILKKSRCLNFTWDTTKKTVNISKKQGPLENLIEYMFKNISYETYYLDKVNNLIKKQSKTLWDIGFRINTDNTNTNIGKWILFESNSVAEFLEEIRTKCKFIVFLNSFDLFAGIVQYNHKLKQPGNLQFCTTSNIIDNNIELVYKDEYRVKVKAIGIQKTELNGKKKDIRVEETVGDFDGDLKTWHCLDTFPDAYYDRGSTTVKRSKTLREKALSILPKFKCDKAKGSITTFGYPKVRKGNIVKIIDPTQKLKRVDTAWQSGLEFFVRSVTSTGGVLGLRQNIELDFRYDTLTPEEIANYNDNKGFKNDTEDKKNNK